MGNKKDKKENEEHISFIQLSNVGKSTLKWLVSNKIHKVAIGEIKWYGAWRKYCFFPYAKTVFDAKCMKGITEFIDNQMELRNAERKSKKAGDTQS